MEKKIEIVCLRCGIDKKEKEVGLGCESWGKSFKQHKWGEWKGKTIIIEPDRIPERIRKENETKTNTA